MLGRTAVVITGANGGIGKALCDTFMAKGYFVVATDMGSCVCNCNEFISCDLNKLVVDELEKDKLKFVFKNILDGKRLKGLVNNAAIQILSDLESLEINDFIATLNVNVTAPLVLTKLLSKCLEQSDGAIVNIGSIHSRLTKPKFISYATSKAALLGLTRALAVDLGGRVRVNAVQPAATLTDMLVEGFHGRQESYDKLKQYHPMLRVATAQEVSDVVLFLISDSSKFISGSAIDVDGGIGCRLHDPE